MIIDVHSHAWRYPEHFGDDFVAQAKRAKADGELDLSVRDEDYRREATDDTRTIVFGGKCGCVGCGSMTSTWRGMWRRTRIR